MNTLVREFFQTEKKNGEPSFHKVLFLSELSESWENCLEKTENLPRGWYELSRLSKDDRIAFTRDFWLARLPFHPTFYPILTDFFSKLEDIEIVLTRALKNAPWIAEMVYSLKENRSFFRGMPPCVEEDIDFLKASSGALLPRDYLAFLHIHNGFGKLSELGLMSAIQASKARGRLMNDLLSLEKPILHKGKVIDPGSFIPFFESFGTASYQCFLTEWYPGNEMGNVYLSGIDYTISDYTDRNDWAEQLAFPTFLDWLAFFIEGNSQER